MNPNDIFAPTDVWNDIALASQGNVAAATRSGYRFATGLAGKRDLNLARYYFMLGVQGIADSSPWVHYLNIQMNVLDQASLPEGTFDKLSVLANGGDVIAMTLLGRVHERGWSGAGRDVAAAKAAYQSVGSQFALAQTLLGELLFRTKHVNAAQNLFQQASEINETRAIVNLALIEVCKRRVVEGKKMLKTAIVQNSCRAMYRLAQLYQHGTGGVEPKPKLALGLLQRAAGMGYPPAVNALENGISFTAIRKPGRRTESASRWKVTGQSA